MADTLVFTVPVPAPSQDSPTSVRVYQSATLTGARALVASATLASIGYTGNPPEELTWAVAAADPTYYSWVVLVSAGGIESQPALLGPAASAGLVTLEVWTENVIGTVQPNLRFEAAPIKGFAAAGNKTILTKAYDPTDANGYASLTLYADSGHYKITLGGAVLAPQFDTTGLSGQTINMADILA